MRIDESRPDGSFVRKKQFLEPGDPTAVAVFEAGVLVGNYSTLNFESGFTVTEEPLDSSQVNITGSGGGGSGNGVEVTVDFGSFGTLASTVVTGQAWVGSSSKLVASFFGTTTDHPSPEEAVIEQLDVATGDIVAGTGFTVYASAPMGTTGQYKVHVLGV